MKIIWGGTFDENFMSRVHHEPNTGCWLWIGSTNGILEYGMHSFRGTRKLAHRAAYEFYVGPIPPGLELDHLCRTPGCVNPDHMEPVTHQENCARGRAGSHNSEKTHCKRGHEFTPENTGRNAQGHRACIACRKERGKP